jgi:hypothetical protein
MFSYGMKIFFIIPVATFATAQAEQATTYWDTANLQGLFLHKAHTYFSLP